MKTSACFIAATMCVALSGCGDAHFGPADDFIDDDTGGLEGGGGNDGDDLGTGATGGSEDGGGGTDGDSGPPAASTEYLFDCDVLVEQLEDLPIGITVDPQGPFVAGVQTDVTVHASVTLDEATVEGVLAFGVDSVDILDSALTLYVDGATPEEFTIEHADVPIEDFDLAADTDGNVIPGPHTFDLGPIDVAVTPTGEFDTVEFGLELEGIGLSLGGVPVVMSLDLPDACVGPNTGITGSPIRFGMEPGDDDGTGGTGGTGGAGGDDGGTGGTDGDDDNGDDGSECVPTRPGHFFDGCLKDRIHDWFKKHKDKDHHGHGHHHEHGNGQGHGKDKGKGHNPVSYTHLTLPTKRIV